MATMGYYRGNMDIAEDKKEEFSARVLKLFYYGGMMQYDEISLCGKELTLIRPAEADADGIVKFHYNYFEDDTHERVTYYTKEALLCSNAIGCREFLDVVTAVHFLYELYDDAIGCVEAGGEIVEGSQYIGWINHILMTDFSLEKRFQLWNQFEGFCLWEINEFEKYGNEKYREIMYRDVVKEFNVRRLVPSSLYHLLEDTEFLDICYITKGTKSLRKEKLEPGSYPDAVYRCKRLLKKYFANSAVEKNKQAERIWELVKSERSVREKLKQEDICAVARMSLELPARVIVYLTCELNKKRFWSVWKELRNVAYTDEKMPQYKSSKFIAERAAAAQKPMSQIGTAQLLCRYDSFMCCNTSQELKDEEECYLPDDDRAFWWDGSEEVVFSNQMQKWLLRLAKRHKELVKEIKDNKRNKEEFLKELVCLLADINMYYKRVFPFQNMFFEFLQNGDDKRYIAAVRLLEEVSRENMEKGKIIEKVRVYWDITSRDITHNAGRMAMKRYLSVMANRKLRKKYFGF